MTKKNKKMSTLNKQRKIYKAFNKSETFKEYEKALFYIAMGFIIGFVVFCRYAQSIIELNIIKII